MNDLIRNCKKKADPLGFEPRQRDSKSLVLPLHQGSKVRELTSLVIEFTRDSIGKEYLHKLS